MTPRLHTPEVAADTLQCTASWLKEQARRRKIPFTMISGQYRFSDAHVEEIIRIFEQRPEPEYPPAPKRRVKAPPQEAAQLRARRPRQRRTADANRRTHDINPETTAADPAHGHCAADTGLPHAQTG